MTREELRNCPATDDQWQNLIEAIILEGVARYRKLRNDIRKGKTLLPGQKQEIAEFERFCLSEWFAQLTTLDGPTLLKKLQEETEYVRTGFIVK